MPVSGSIGDESGDTDPLDCLGISDNNTIRLGMVGRDPEQHWSGLQVHYRLGKESGMTSFNCTRKSSMLPITPMSSDASSLL